jgi:hypothetical protein
LQWYVQRAVSVRRLSSFLGVRWATSGAIALRDIERLLKEIESRDRTELPEAKGQEEPERQAAIGRMRRAG